MSRRYCNNRCYYYRNRRQSSFDAVLLIFVFILLSEVIKKLLVVAAIVAVMAVLLFVVKPRVILWYRLRKGREELVKMVKEAGATDIEVDPETGQISFKLPREDKEEVLEAWKEYMASKGIKLNSRYEKQDMIKTD